MTLMETWRVFLRSDVFFWRQLRRLRSLNRALLRSNRELLVSRREWEKERDLRYAGDFWYQRWRQLSDRPAYVVQSSELARARTEIVRLRAEVATLRRAVAAATSPAAPPVDPSWFGGDSEVFRGR
jgi:hypothetical protein